MKEANIINESNIIEEGNENDIISNRPMKTNDNEGQ